MEFLKKIFSPPSFNTDDLNRRSKFLTITILSGITFNIMIFVLSIFFHWLNGLIVTSIVFIMLLGAFFALMKGKLNFSTSLTLVAFSSAVLINMYISIGIYDLSVYLIPFIIIIAAFLLKKKGFIVYSSLLIFFFVAVGLMAWYFHRKLPTPLTDFYGDLTLLIIFFSFTIILVTLFLSSLLSYMQKSEEKEKKIQNIFNSIQDVYFELDLKGHLMAINNSAEQFFELSTDTLLGKDFFKLFLETEKRDFRTDLFSKNQISSLELKYSNKIASINLTLIRNEIQEPIYIIGSIRDITQLKEKEEQLRQSQKMEAIGKLVGGISHDFNNLLTVINGYSSIILNEMSKDDKFYEYMELISRSGEKASDLTKKLLAFSRKQIYTPKIVSLNSIVLDFEKMLKRVIEEDIQLEIHLSDPIYNIFADPVQLEQIIMNLVVNARDAFLDTSNHKKIIQIKTKNVSISQNKDVPDGDYVLFQLLDNGIGIDDNIKHKIFDPFFTTKEINKGTGMGLSTVLGIVKQNNAILTFESEVNKGTTFNIFWPKSQEQENNKLIFETTEQNLQGNLEKILFVDDEKDVLSFGETILKKNNYQVFSLAKSEDVMSFLKEQQPEIDVLITDLVMPNVNGKMLAEMVKKLYPNVKIIYTSGYASEKIVKNWEKDDSIIVIQKPYKGKDLLLAVRDKINS